MANLVCMVLTLVTLNANGLHDSDKWLDLWLKIPKHDIICLQETHLEQWQEYSFTKFAQSFDFFFSHSTTNSGGICVAIRHSLGVIAHKTFEIPGHLLALDLDGLPDDCPQRIIGIYAPSVSKD